MEPLGSVRSLRYGAVIHGRGAKRLRKRHRPPDLVATEHRVTMPTMTPHARLRSVALAAIVALTFAACDPATPSVAPTTGPSAPSSSAPSSPPSSAATDAIYDAIEAQVVEMRGLGPVDVKRETLDAEAAGAFHINNFDGDNPPEDIAANERLYKALGLLSPDQSLKPLYLDLLTSQVAGFYRPEDKKLYVVSRTGAIGGADKITFAHEYDHALQDSAFPVFKDMKALLEHTDEALARAAIYEGDATWLMLQWGNANLTPEEFAAAQAAGADPEIDGGPCEDAADPRRGPALPVHGRRRVRGADPHGWWMGRGGCLVRRPASVDRADPPPG